MRRLASGGAERLFVQMCVMAGCDYVDSLPGIGIVKALDLVVKYRSTPADRRIKAILEHLASTSCLPNLAKQAANTPASFCC